MLDSLHIKNFRCFEDLTIPSLGRVNLIVGKNSVGKSSILEAVYIFANRGRQSEIRNILSARNEIFRNDDSIEDIFFGRKFPKEDSVDEHLIIGDNDQFVYMYFNNNTNIVFGFNKRGESNKLALLTINPIPYGVVHTDVLPEDYLAYLWDDVSINSEEDSIKDALKIITPQLVNVIFVKSPKEDRQDRIAIVKLKGESKGIPLKSFGEGMSRLLQIFLHAFKARGGYLMIDEFENGLHYSIQEEVWKKLFKLEKELNIQVFATTHSEDTVKAFCKVSLADDEVDGKLISLGRSAAIADNGKILADVYDEKTLAWIVQSGMEVR